MELIKHLHSLQELLSCEYTCKLRESTGCIIVSNGKYIMHVTTNTLRQQKDIKWWIESNFKEMELYNDEDDGEQDGLLFQE